MNAMLSIDNGHSYYTSVEIENVWNAIRPYYHAIVQAMDDDVREEVHADIAPCTDAEFLSEYLRRASDDIIIG